MAEKKDQEEFEFGYADTVARMAPGTVKRMNEVAAEIAQKAKKLREDKTKESEQAAKRQGGEFFYIDKDGNIDDTALHEDWLNIGPQAEARVREIGKQAARDCGLSEADIAILYPDEQ
jgi:hypothetical protein